MPICTKTSEYEREFLKFNFYFLDLLLILLFLQQAYLIQQTLYL